MKKVLICAPIGGAKQYSIIDWFEWIAHQTYENYDVALCVNGVGKNGLASKLFDTEWNDIHKQIKKPIVLIQPNSMDSLGKIQRITYAREQLRRYAVDNNYDAVFWLDTDTLPYFADSIKVLLEKDVDSISGLYFYKKTRTAIMIDTETKTNVSIERIKRAVVNDEMFEILEGGYGCVLHQREALKTPFDYSLFGRFFCDDIGHCNALKEKGIKLWFYPRIICLHISDPEDNTEKKYNAMKL